MRHLVRDSHISAGYPATLLVSRVPERGLRVLVAHLCMRSLHRKGSISGQCGVCSSLVQLAARVSSAKTRRTYIIMIIPQHVGVLVIMQNIWQREFIPETVVVVKIILYHPIPYTLQFNTPHLIAEGEGTVKW